MRIQDLLGSPPFIALGFVIGRVTPPRFGYWLSRRVARAMARRRTALFRTIRDNLTHVLGDDVTAAELDRAAEEVVAHAGRTYFDMFHQGPHALATEQSLLRVLPEEWEMIRTMLAEKRGTVIVGPHMSNFDMALQWLATHGVDMQALGLAGPNLGTRSLNSLRRLRGVAIKPIDLASLREAVTHLKNGGVVVTGVDRPVFTNDEPLPFFGAPARMPTGHVRLALQTDARIVVACCLQESDGHYVVRFWRPLEMVKTGVRAEDLRVNAIRVLQVVEALISLAPTQWLMFVPVWPPEDVEMAEDGAPATADEGVRAQEE